MGKKEGMKKKEPAKPKKKSKEKEKKDKKEKKGSKEKEENKEKEDEEKKVPKEKKEKESPEQKAFESQIAKLQAALIPVLQELEHLEPQLENAKKRLSAEKDVWGSCIRHLRRVLGRRSNETDTVQQQLQTEEDRKKLNEQKVDTLFQNLDRNREVEMSLFQQEKSQLEDKLSRLEDKRLARHTQLARLKELEGTLKDKQSAERLRSRQTDLENVSHLLQRRDIFANLVDSIVSESEEVNQLSLPVRAKADLEKNIQLRNSNREVSENVLTLQGQLRTLKGQQKVVETELETCSIKVDTGSTKVKKKRLHFEFLTKEAKIPKPILPSVKEEDLQSLRKDLDCKMSQTALLTDKMEIVLDMLEDQACYQKVLEGRIQEARNRNGFLGSLLLKSAEMAKARLGEMTASHQDTDLMIQIAMLLDDGISQPGARIQDDSVLVVQTLSTQAPIE